MAELKHLEYRFAFASYELIKACSPLELKFYLWLKLWATGKDKHSAFPSTETIMEELNIGSKATLYKLLTDMESSGRLKIYRKHRKNNVYDFTRYDSLVYTKRTQQCTESVHQQKEIKQKESTAFLKKSGSSPKSMEKFYNEDGTTGEIIDLEGNPIKKAAAAAKIKKPRFSPESIDLLQLFEKTYAETITKKPLALNIPTLCKRAEPYIKKLGIDRMKELCLVFLTTDKQYYRDVAWSPYIFLTDNVIHELNAKN